VVRRGVFKRVEYGRRPPTLWAGHPRNGHKAVSGVARLRVIEGSGMAGPGETLGSPWPSLAIHPCSEVNPDIKLETTDTRVLNRIDSIDSGWPK
jgi:hypothetical protein